MKLTTCRNGHVRDSSNDGGPCKTCKAARLRRYRLKNATTIAAKSHEYYLTNRQRIATYMQSRYQKHKERYNAYAKAYATAHPEKVVKSSRNFYAKNRAKLIAKSKAYRENNPEKIKAACASYQAAHKNELSKKRIDKYWAKSKEERKAYTKAIAAKMAAYHRERRTTHPQQTKAYYRDLNAKHIKLLYGSYVRKVLLKQLKVLHQHFATPRITVVPALVDAKRQQLLFHRALKETKRVIENHFASKEHQPSSNGRSEPNADRRTTNRPLQHNDGRSTRRS